MIVALETVPMDCPLGKDFLQPERAGRLTRGVVKEFTRRSCDAARNANKAMQKCAIVKEYKERRRLR